MALHRLANLWLFVYGVMSRTNASVMSCRYCSQRCHDNGTPYSSSSYTLSCCTVSPFIPSLISSLMTYLSYHLLVFMVYGVMSQTNTSVCLSSSAVSIAMNTKHYLLLIFLFPSPPSLLSSFPPPFFKDILFTSPSSFPGLWIHEPTAERMLPYVLLLPQSALPRTRTMSPHLIYLLSFLLFLLPSSRTHPSSLLVVFMVYGVM